MNEKQVFFLKPIEFKLLLLVNYLRLVNQATRAYNSIAEQRWKRVTGHRVNDFGRVGSGLGSRFF